MKKRVKKELTFKEAKRLCAIITIVVSSIIIVPTIVTLVTSRVDLDMKIAMGLISIFLFPLITYFFLNLILKIEWLEFKEELEIEKEICKDFLSKETFVQVTFLPQEKSIEAKMCFSILEKTGCTFFAKFDNEENIILIVKDKENKEIYKQEISNYRYFNLRFKKTEN